MYQLLYAFWKFSKIKFGDTLPFGCSIAPTIRCNLRCDFCYEKARRFTNRKEMSKHELSILSEDLVRNGIKHCTLTDGEPLLDNDSIEKCEVIINRFWMCYIVTNGTNEFIDFPATYIVSLDGPRKVHEKLRNCDFTVIKNNIKKSPNDNIYVLTTLNTYNRKYIKETIEESKNLGVRGIMFNWYTPFKNNDPFWVPYEDRNKDIDLILSLHETDDFIYNTKYELTHLRSFDWTKKCPRRYIISIDAFGKQKKPCIFGENVKCECCGCHVYPALYETINKFRVTVQLKLAIDFVRSYWIR